MIQDRPFSLSSTTLDKLNSVFAQHSAIHSVLIYGSRAKGNYRAGSDIDLTIKGDEIPFAEFMHIENQIDDLMLPYTVDLSPSEGKCCSCGYTISQYFRESVA